MSLSYASDLSFNPVLLLDAASLQPLSGLTVLFAANEPASMFIFDRYIRNVALSAIPAGLFEPLTQLELLSLAGNNILEIDATAFQSNTAMLNLFALQIVA